MPLWITVPKFSLDTLVYILLHMQGMEKLSVNIALRIYPKLLKKLKAAAKADRRTVPDFIRIALEEACK